MTNSIEKRPVKQVFIDNEHAQRRIDNYLIGEYGNIPKSRIYQMLRKGEVRVNGHRVKQTYRLQPEDKVRLPPIYIENRKEPEPSEKQRTLMREQILYEDNALIVFNKPAGFSVHAGSKQKYGIIEILRAVSSNKMELVHRLDKQTSGCLLIAKDMVALKYLHLCMRNGQVDKIYHALLCGRLSDDDYDIDVPVYTNRVRSGERMVEAGEGGKCAMSRFSVKIRYSDATLVKVRLFTGRTHQIRVHAKYFGHPVVGDHKYGDKSYNKKFSSLGLKSMFLHAASLKFHSPDTGKKIVVNASLPDDLTLLLRSLR